MTQSPFIGSGSRAWLDPSASELRTALVLLAATLLYLAYYLLIRPATVSRLFPRATSEAALRTTTSFFRKGLGAVLFGVVPMVALALAWPRPLSDCGLSLDAAPRSLLYAGAFIALMLPLLWVQTAKPAFRAIYPEVRAPFTGRVAVANAAAWTAYLVGYEFLFRGVLVVGLSHELGALPALAVSLLGYVFVHLGAYPAETIGTLFTGTLFGIVALDTGSILMPVVAHIGVAVTSDLMASRPLASRLAREGD